MLTPERLRSLASLIEDDSPVVLEAVLKELSALGAELEARLRALDPPLPDELIYLTMYLVDDWRHGTLLMAKPPLSGPQSPARPGTAPRLFIPGQIVQHRTNRYRGVVVDFDSECRADSDWYHAARPETDYNQPWYYVLVHRTYQVTYVAQYKLQLDLSGEEVVHPLLKHFFTAFEDGFYVRNEKPWPRSHER